MANIRDVASLANVSLATASRALNNKPNVSEATRRLVLMAAYELGYIKATHPGVLAIPPSILVLTRDEEKSSSKEVIPRDRYFDQEVWEGVHSVFEQYGIATRIQRSRMLVEEARDYTPTLGISGLVLLGGIINLDFVRELIKVGTPFVTVGSHLSSLRVNSVMADVLMGSKIAVDHFVERGHKCIGLVNGPPTTGTSQAKLYGFHLGISINGLTYNPSRVISDDFSAEAGYRSTLALLAKNPDLDSILYSDTQVALGGMRALRTLGKKIPSDIAIVSFGNYEIALYTDPPLTTLSYDIREMGAIAAQRIYSLLKEPNQHAWNITVPIQLIIREST